MKKAAFLSVLLLLMLTACGKSQTAQAPNSTAVSGGNVVSESGQVVSQSDEGSSSAAGNKEKTEIMNIQIGEQTLTAALADNSSVEALKKLLSEGPVTIQMEDYAGMEKVGPLGTSIPTNDEQITTEAGDIILYQGDKLVIYYGSNSWNFTRIGKISCATPADLKKMLGSGSVTVTISLAEQ